MAVELKSFLDFVGIESTDDMTQEDLHQKFADAFVKRDTASQDESIVKSVIGKHLGSLDTNIRRIAKENGVEITDDLKNSKVEDLLSHTLNGINASHTAKINELTAQMDNADVDAIRSEWSEKYTKLEGKYNDTLGLLNDTKTQFETFKSQKDNEIRDFKLSTTLSKHYGDANYKSDITDIEKVGFRTYMDNKYKADFDENGNPFMVNRQTGERIKNEKKMGEFMGIGDIINMELSAQKLMAVNNTAENGQGQKKKLGQSLQHVQETTTVRHASNNGTRSRTISNRALK